MRSERMKGPPLGVLLPLSAPDAPILDRRDPPSSTTRHPRARARPSAVSSSDERQFTNQVQDLLATGPLAHVVTLDPDGTPYITLAWAGFDGDELVFATFFGTDQRKLRNLRREIHV